MLALLHGCIDLQVVHEVALCSLDALWHTAAS